MAEEKEEQSKAFWKVFRINPFFSIRLIDSKLFLCLYQLNILFEKDDTYFYNELYNSLSIR